MDVEQVLQELTHCDRLPVEAIRAASADRAAVVPRLIDAIENYIQERDSKGKEDELFLAFHLLGEWREKSAYRLLARFLRCADVEYVLGDATTETSQRVMAAVFDGDPQPLYDVILDAEADEFIRARMCDAVAMVTVRGELPRQEAARFLRACFTDLRPQDECYVWEGWQGAVSALGLAELKPLVEEAFDRGFIAPEVMKIGHFEKDLEWALAHPDHPWDSGNNEYALWDDTIGVFSSWERRNEQYKRDRERRLAADYEPSWFPQPAVNVYKNVGRNDPCPCGSGKKFKKCCLNSISAAA